MKTKRLGLAALLLVFLSNCRQPELPNAEPTIRIFHPEKPAIQLPWQVLKGSRLADSPLHIHHKLLVEKRFFEKSPNRENL